MTQNPLKRNVTVIKFGGGVIGESGQGIPLIVNKIQTIRKKDGIGPVVVVSAPKGLTNRVIKVGNQIASGSFSNAKFLMEPYETICDQQIHESFKDVFHEKLKLCYEEAINALERISRNREFGGQNRAIALAYTGELIMAASMHYVLISNGIESYALPFSEWPIITDRNFQSATFLFKESRRKIHNLVKKIEEEKIIIIGGFIGKTINDQETTFERGGSDRTAIDLGILLKSRYAVTVDLQKDSVVLSADPKVEGINIEKLEAVKFLSYNETLLAGQYGMKIIDPVAIRDIPKDMDLVIHVTNISTGEKSIIQRNGDGGNEHPIKIVTGRKSCAILEIKQSKTPSIYDFIEGIRKYFEFTELRPYIKNDVRIGRFLFFDGNYLKENLIHDLQGIDAEVIVDYGLAAVTLIGDRMAQASGIVASAFEGIKQMYPDLVILDGDVQRPTSSILIIVRETDKDRCVSAIHKIRREISHNNSTN